MKQSVFDFENEGFYYLFKEHSGCLLFFPDALITLIKMSR